MKNTSSPASVATRPAVPKLPPAITQHGATGLTPGKVKQAVQGTSPKHFPWLGNKLMEPRRPGAGKAHRMQQLQQSGYKVKIGSLIKPK